MTKKNIFFILFLFIFYSCNKNIIPFVTENNCGDKELLIYQIHKPTKNLNTEFIVVLNFWNGNFKAFLNQIELHNEQTDDEKTTDYLRIFKFSAKNHDEISIVYENGECFHFEINDKYNIYEIYSSLQYYKVYMKLKF